MDIIALVKEGLQTVAEHVVSYKIGQTVLRHVDKALWVVEKCARWAVPPPLDPEERPQPELVRPLPWVFFLMLLVALRVARESISLVNLVLGKPPLRSADVVTYVQSKRRYLRTLKYQGNRMMRARTSTVQEPWYSGLRSLFEFTMCFKRQSIHYGNNNTQRVSNNDEILIVKRSKRPRQDESPAASTSEATMERLIEKMMVDLDADSNDDSSYTLTNATSVKSDRSEDSAESDQEAVTNDVSTNSQDTQDNITPHKADKDQLEPEENTPPKPDNETPTKDRVEPAHEEETPVEPSLEKETPLEAALEKETPVEPALEKETPVEPALEKGTPVEPALEKETPPQSNEDLALRSVDRRSPVLESQAFLQSEKQSTNQRSPKQKIANGRTVKSTSEKNIGGGKRDTAAAVARTASADFTSRGRKENLRQTP